MKRIIPLILVVALLLAGVYYVRRADQSEQSQIATLYTEVEPLQKEKANLVAERSKLVDDFRVSLRDASTVQILFRELGEEVFEYVYPLMREYGVTGVLGVSSKQFPGRTHMMTVEQYNRLLMDGWGSCLIFETDYQNHVDNWLSYMQRHLERENLAMPKAVYFPDGGYDAASMDELLLGAGIETIILNAADGHSETVTEVGKLWMTGAMPWNYTGIAADVALLAITDSANLCFTASIENLWDAIEPEAFAAMLSAWQSVLVSTPISDQLVPPSPSPTPNVTGAKDEPEVEPMLRVTTFEKARAAHLETQENLSRIVQEHEDAIAELDARIAELDAQIEAVYRKWNRK